MESIRKIVISFLGVIALSHSVGCVGQNIYNSNSVYYNWDTLLCVDEKVSPKKDDEHKPYSGSSDSIRYYYSHCKFNKTIDLPIVTVTDENIINKIDSCLIDAYQSDYLLFPDSSGYFIELYIYEPDDSLSLGMSITPFSNYYMAEILSDWRNDVVNEWFGRNYKDLHACFYKNGILCIVTSSGRINYKRASCLFPNTQSSIKLVLFSPIIGIVNGSHVTQLKYYYFFRECLTN